MINLDQRSTELEIMDLPNPPSEAIRLAVKEIEKINVLLGGFNQSLQDISRFNPEKHTLSIQDWGCGSGDLLRKIRKWGEERSYHLDLTGMDLDRETIFYANENTADPSIKWECRDVLSGEIPDKSADLVISCLFTHHFVDEDWIRLIREMIRVSKKGVIINDLHRHPLAYYSIGILTRWFAKSYMVRNDAPLSVAKGFTRKELISLLKKAGVATYSLQWKWAFRWSLVIYTSE